MRKSYFLRPRKRGFTLIELLVVILIILLVSIVTLPTIVPAYNHRQIGESARILQAALVGARDSAIRANAPRGIRLLVDPVFHDPVGALAANRWIAIEPAPDYSEGQVLAYKPLFDTNGNELPDENLPNLNPPSTLIGLRNGLPLLGSNPTFTGGLPPLPLRLVVVEAKLRIPLIPVTVASSTVNTSYSPSGWFWNIRQGDKIRFGDSGNYYTIAGPIRSSVNDNPQVAATVPDPTNPERYVNFGKNVVANWSRPTNNFTEFLYLLNGLDDDNDGYIDEACDGLDNDGDGIVDPGYNGVDDNGNGLIDEAAELLIGTTVSGGVIIGGEFEIETFVGLQAHAAHNQTYNYTIYRRPIVSPGSKEVALPADIVIDLTTWNAPAAIDTKGTATPSYPERSRLPLDPFTFNVDIMLNPNGSVASGGVITANSLRFSPIASLPFYHFWLSERSDVSPPLFTAAGGPLISNPSYPVAKYMLPMPQGTPNYSGSVFLQGERRMVTLFTRTGQIVTNEINRDPYLLSDGVTLGGGSFNGLDINAPFYDAQIGAREAK